MRRLMMAAAITALAGAGSLIGGSAQALPGVAGLPGAHNTGLDSGLVEQTQLVCPRPFWNGWRWVQPPCHPAYAPRYYAPYAPYAYGPPPIVVRPWRRRVYVY
jgi:hypothetical protein